MINDTFKRIQVRAQAMLQNTSTSTTNANDLLPKVKDWCRTRYDRILRSYPWRELLRNYSLSVTASTADYALRYDLESIVKMWDTTHGNEVFGQDVTDYVRFDAPIYEVAGNTMTGTPDYYIHIGNRSVSALLSTADQVQVLSTSSSDTDPKVIRISGEVSGIQVSESITLNGTTAVDSTNTFDSGSELIVSAGTSDGTLSDLAGVVTVREKTTSANVLAKIAPEERAPSYMWIKFSPTLSAAATMKVWYKMKWKPLNNDNDVPLVPCANEIVEGVIADALFEDGQENAAVLQEKKFSSSVAELWNSRKPRNLIKQMIPETENNDLTNDRLFWA